MENSQHRRPDEVARSGTVNINYSRRNELTQHVEIRAPRAASCQNGSRRATCYRNGVDTADEYQHDEL
jgi:hypothetical protein